MPVDPCYRPTIRKLGRRLLPLLYAGRRVRCPCCGRTFGRFVRRFDSDRMCPYCLSLRRHRSFWLFLKEQLAYADELSILHFAPEEGISAQLRADNRIDYVSADLDPRSIATRAFDITAIPFDDAEFDVVLCNHVLEHVVEDRRAMRELFRVLKPGGVLYSMHPVNFRLERTVEDPSVVAPNDRARLYGQSDHVRTYGRDFVERLGETGFEVTVELFGGELSEEALRLYDVRSRTRIFVCRRPRRTTNQSALRGRAGAD
jgi:SAM-dependent methyltransferase